MLKLMALRTSSPCVEVRQIGVFDSNQSPQEKLKVINDLIKRVKARQKAWKKELRAKWKGNTDTQDDIKSVKSELKKLSWWKQQDRDEIAERKSEQKDLKTTSYKDSLPAFSSILSQLNQLKSILTGKVAPTQADDNPTKLCGLYQDGKLVGLVTFLQNRLETNPL